MHAASEVERRSLLKEPREHGTCLVLSGFGFLDWFGVQEETETSSKISGFGFFDQGSGFRDKGYGFGVWGSGCGVWGVGLRVWGNRCDGAVEAVVPHLVCDSGF